MLGRLAFLGDAGLGVKDCAGARGLTALLTLDAAWSTSDETVDNAPIARPIEQHGILLPIPMQGPRQSRNPHQT